jgi:hypothetical protein
VYRPHSRAQASSSRPLLRASAALPEILSAAQCKNCFSVSLFLSVAHLTDELIGLLEETTGQVLELAHYLLLFRMYLLPLFLFLRQPRQLTALLICP